VELTDFGALMLPYAQSIANLQYEYEAAALRFQTSGTAPLVIGTIPVIPKYNITEILIRYQLDFPSVEVKTIEEDTLLLRDKLFDHKCDLIFFRDSDKYVDHNPEKEAQITRIPFAVDRLVAVLPTDHPLAEEESIELQQLATEEFAFIKDGSMPYNLCIQVCQEAGFTPHVLFTSHQLEALFDMVTKGSCVSLLFEKHAAKPFKDLAELENQKMLSAPYKVVPIEPAVYTTLYLGYLKQAPLSNAAMHFLEYFRRSIKSDLD